MMPTTRPSALLLAQAARFSLVGVLNTLVDFAVFALLVRAGLHYLAAQVGAYACGLTCSFLLNRSWTFRYRGSGDPLLPARFLLVNLCAWSVVELALLLLVGRAELSALAVKVLATPLSLAVNFLGNRFWVFRAPTLAHPQSATSSPKTGSGDTG
jgi:putative flippase GtrA